MSLDAGSPRAGGGHPQALLGALLSPLTAWMGAIIKNRPAGLIAGSLMVVCWPLTLYNVAILSTALAVFLSTLCCAQALRLLRHPSGRGAAALGLITGLAITCRPNFLLFAPVALRIASVPNAPTGTPGRWQRMALFSACLLLPILPVFLNNALRGTDPVLLTHTAGINLFIGNNQGATGRLDPTFGTLNAAHQTRLFRQKAQKALGHPVTLGENSRFWARQTLREIEDNPSRFFALLGRKLLYGINAFDTPDSLNPPFLERIVPLFGLPMPGLPLLFPLGIAGLIVMWREAPRYRFIHAAMLVPVATMLLFFVTARYRAPWYPLLAIGAGGVITTVPSWITAPSGRIRSVVITLVGVLAAAVVVNLPLLHPDFTIDRQRLRRALQPTPPASVEADTATRDEYPVRPLFVVGPR